MVEVKVKDVSKLEDLFQRNIDACKLAGRTSFMFLRSSVIIFLSNGTGKLWVDDLEDPHAILFVTVGKQAILNEDTAYVNSLYIDEEYRSSEKMTEMLDVAELWARSKECKRIQASSWVFDGCADLCKVWENLGFAKQEIILTKKI